MADDATTIPTTEAVLAEIQRILRDEVGLHEDVSPETELQAGLALDSMSLLTLVVSLEDRFRVILQDESAASIRTVGELAAYVVRRVEETC